ncbi:hypothetical protein [Variovorax sp. PCZ-1]|uniref:hypothetical protein n=1 Tax=Variovorax sp. PCZ-1 TaxID=2835533 RepID=UPI001BCAAA20|nr:hypothetical protein [Variovorax sp. PCZ-1]MBS7807056.1 hypothetical protein [Variovorax sp. PCZ-1]
MSHSLSHALGRASHAARLLIGIALVAFLAACGGNATTTGAVGDDSDGSVLIVSTFAGKAGEPGYANGQGGAARFQGPSGLAVDNFGNVYVGDSENYVVRKITPSGHVSLFAGTPGGIGNENGPPGTAKFRRTHSLAVDASLNVYVADVVNHNVKKINAFGVVSSFAGRSDGQRGDDDGPLSEAQFDAPHSVVAGKDGTIYVAQGPGDDKLYALRSISPQGTVTTLGGVSYEAMNAVTLDNLGNRYVVRKNSIERILAGASAFSAFSGSLDVDTSFNPLGMVPNFAIDKNGNAFMMTDDVIRQVKPDGSVSIFAGAKNTRGSQDGLLLDARFNTKLWGVGSASGLAIAPDGSMYVSDFNNHTIRKISKGFYVGGVVRGLTGAGKVNVQNNGAATQSLSNGSFTFSMPVAQSATYNVQILSAEGHSCTVSNPTGQVTTTVSSIVVDCAPIVQPPQYSAGGVVSGLLSGQTVILKNGADLTVPLGNGNYTFLVKAANGTSYNVVVDTQPIGRTCSVADGNSAINNANVTNVNVSCVTSTHSISGFASGLGAGAVQLQINSSPTQTVSANGRFILTNTIQYGSNFDVNITSQPVGQTCEWSSLGGIAASSARVTGTVAGDVSLDMTCSTNTYTVTAAVMGTSGTETVSLQMTGTPSGTQTLLLTGSTPSAFTNRVPHGTSVGLAVLSSPAGKTCSLTSPATITVTGVSNVTVNCVVNAPVFYTVGGTVGVLPAFTTIDLMMASSDFASNQMLTGLGNGAYQFLTTVPSGSTISIATTSPPGYSCTVASPYAAGMVITGNVSNANVSCVSTGGGGGGGGFTPGTVNGQVTNNGPDTRTILMTNGVNQVSVVVNSNSTAHFTLPGQLAQGDSYNVTASDVTAPTPPSGALNCSVGNGTGNMVALPGAVSNVSVTCQLAIF